MYYGHMGFEKPRRRMRAERREIGAHYPYLSDYPDLTQGYASGSNPDGETEHATWPDLIDQRQLARWCGPYAADDAEEDDHPGGNITDEPHDAREEDGI